MKSMAGIFLRFHNATIKWYSFLPVWPDGYTITSVTKWLHYYFPYLSIYNYEDLPNISKYCQSSYKIWPNT